MSSTVPTFCGWCSAHSRAPLSFNPTEGYGVRVHRLADDLQTGNFSFARGTALATFVTGVSGGVTVAQGPLEAFVMVRIHAGQPTQ